MVVNKLHHLLEEESCWILAGNRPAAPTLLQYWKLLSWHSCSFRKLLSCHSCSFWKLLSSHSCSYSFSLSLSCLLRSSELLPAFPKNPFIFNSLTNNFYRERTEHNCSISSLCIDPFISCQVFCAVFWECCSAIKEFKQIHESSFVIVEKVKVLDKEIFHCQVCSFFWFDSICNLETFPVDSLFCPKLSVLAPWDHPSNDSRAERN